MAKRKRDSDKPLLRHYLNQESSTSSDEELEIEESTSRKFLQHWLKKFLWAHYDAEKDMVICSVCVKAGKRNDYACYW